MEKGRVFTGARALFKINGKTVGYASNVSGSEAIEYQPLEVLGNIEVEEYVPVAYRVTFTAEMFRIVGETVKSQGFFPGVGGNSSEHLENILISGDMTATLEDTKKDAQRKTKIIATWEQVKIASHNFTVTSRGVTGTNCEFVAIRMRDESEI